MATRVSDGRGGISTALAELSKSVTFREAEVQYIDSHSETRRVSTLLTAIEQVSKHAGPGAIFWFHCGPWLSMTRKAMLAALARRCGARVVLHLHSTTLSRYLSSRSARVLLRRLFHLADGIVVLTPWWKAQVLRHLPDLECPIHVSPNALGPDWIRLAGRPRDKDPGSRVVWLSRMVEGKGVLETIGAIESLPRRFRLVVAGDGPLRDEVRQFIVDRKLSNRVELMGWVGHADKIRLLQESDVFCLPSEHDSFGMGYIEAMAVGLPVIGLRQGGVPDVVPNGEAGILLDDSHPTKIATAIQECERRGMDMGRRGQAEVVRRFDAESIGADLLRFFESLERPARASKR